MKQKVGILTTYFAANYGAMLQPFALKRVLECEGCDVEMIRYGQQDILEVYDPFCWKRYFKQKLSACLAAWLFMPWAIAKEMKFRRFMYRYINGERGFEKQIPQDKEVYFIGSDQLWRTFGKNEHFDPVYMGYFATMPGARKVSYAVSGEHLQLNEANCQYLREAFRNFDMISVREQKRADDFQPLADGKPVEVVLDPTLLAEPSLYQELQQIDPCPGKRYVLFYCVRRSQHFVQKVYEYARQRGLHLLIFSEGFKPSLIKFAALHRDVHYLMTAGEEEFLGAMSHAESVFTPSFHGAAFSIINHRNLYSLMVDDGADTRSRHLLTQLGMQYRLLRIGDEIDERPIDYTEVERLLRIQRNHSLDFVRRALHRC